MTAQREPMPADATLTASGIARLAGVGRAAVSNWRRRHADFPQPVSGTPSSPNFNASEVEEWLRREGKLHQVGAGQQAWRQIETYQPSAQLGQALGIAGAYLLAEADQPHRGASLRTPTQLARALRAIDHSLAKQVSAVLPDKWTPELQRVLQATSALAHEHDPERAFEFLHNRYTTSAQSMSGLATTPDNVAELMAALAGDGANTFDFTCGTGSILRAAAEQAISNGAPTACHAQEIRPEYALIALIRLWFVHRRAQRTTKDTVPPPKLYVGDSLRADAFGGLKADVVIANFPFGIHDWGHDELAYDPRWTYGLPPRTEPELAWVQHALAHVAPAGAVVVLMPPAAASRPAGRRIRAELVRRGSLRAVIALPAGMMAPSSVGLHIWILTERPDQDPIDEPILFIDASEDEKPAEFIVRSWRRFQSGKPTVGGAAAGGHALAVPAIELLGERVDLTPLRHISAHTQPSDASTVLIRIEELKRQIAELTEAMPSVRPDGQAATSPQATLADLIRAGSVTAERIFLRADDADNFGTTGNAPEPRIRPNDIVVYTSGGQTTAKVITLSASPVDFPAGAHLLRVDPKRFDPWFVAGALSSRRRLGMAGLTASGSRPTNLRQHTVPVVPLPEQRILGQAMRQLEEFQGRLENLAELGAAVARDMHEGLLSRALTARID